MIAPISNFLAMISGDGRRNKVVPPTGFTATLSTATSAIMAFLVVFALVLSLAADRLAARWSTALSGSATLRVSASADQLEAQVQQALQVLQTTSGIASARVMSADEQRALLEPWFGP
jgi:cell division transport system permease protein